LKKKFQVQVDENTAVELELTGISELKQYPRQEEFALEFRGPANMFLGQGIRFFKHEQMGQFEIFIVPIRQDNQGLYYEAVFNRVRE
jgi:predicted deacetylase